MNRRDFMASLIGAAGATFLPIPTTSAPQFKLTTFVPKNPIKLRMRVTVENAAELRRIYGLDRARRVQKMVTDALLEDIG